MCVKNVLVIWYFIFLFLSPNFLSIHRNGSTMSGHFSPPTVWPQERPRWLDDFFRQGGVDPAQEIPRWRLRYSDTFRNDRWIDSINQNHQKSDGWVGGHLIHQVERWQSCLTWEKLSFKEWLGCLVQNKITCRNEEIYERHVTTASASPRCVIRRRNLLLPWFSRD